MLYNLLPSFTINYATAGSKLCATIFIHNTTGNLTAWTFMSGQDKRMEGWKAGRLEGWKAGWLEDWKDGGLEVGRLTVNQHIITHYYILLTFTIYYHAFPNFTIFYNTFPTQEQFTIFSRH